MAFSTSEADNIRLGDSGSDAKWIRACLSKLGLELNSASPLYYDNTAAKSWAEIAASMKQTKHMDIKFHFVKEATRQIIIEP